MAIDVFREAILQMREIGAFNFLFPFLLTMAIFYGLLRKSKIFGPPETNVAVNAIVSLVAAFMVWAYPVINGVDIEAKLSSFFAQGIIVTLVLMMAMLGSGMVLPPDYDFKKMFGERGGLIIVGIVFALSIVIVITSGLVGIIINPEQITSLIPKDYIITIGLILFVLIVMVWIVNSGKPPASSNGGGEKKGG